MQFADTPRARVGRRQPDLGLAVRPVALRFRLSDPETALRPHSMVPVRRRNAVLIAALRRPRSLARGARMGGQCRIVLSKPHAESDGRRDRRSSRGRQARARRRRSTGASAISRRSTPPAPSDISFLDNPKYPDELATTRAGACLMAPRFRSAGARRACRAGRRRAVSRLRRGHARAVSRGAAAILAVRHDGRSAEARSSSDRAARGRRHRRSAGGDRAATPKSEPAR